MNETVIRHGGKLKTVTKYMPDGKNVYEKETTDNTTEGQTVITTDSGRTRKVKTTKTNPPDYEKQENFDLAQDGTPTRTTSTEKSNGVTTKTDYKKKTRTIADTKNNTDTEITFSSFYEKSGDITVAKTVVTDKTNHSRITTNTDSKTKIIETLDNNNKTVKRTATIDTEKHTATIEVNGKKITLNTDSQGNILANAKFTGSRMETVGEAAIRLGYAKDSEEYNAIVKANGRNAKKGIKPGGHIKLPSNANTTTGLNTDNAVVDAKAEKRKWVNHQISIRETNRAKYAQKAYDRYNKTHGDTLRETWATKSLQIYCEKGDDKTNGKGYVQHKIYDATSNTLVNLEKYLNLGKDEHVKRITEDGSAILTNGKTVKINIKTRKASNLSVSDYNKSFTDSTRKGAKGEISGTVNKDKHKFVYQGDYATNVLTNEKWVRNEDGNYTQLNTTNRTNDGVYADNKTTTDEKNNEIADDIYSAADYKSGGTAAKLMYSRITQYIDKNNVMEVYETYQQRHSDDDSIIETITSEWLGYGAGHGRDYAVRSAKYLLNKFIERAKTAGVPEKDLQKAKNSVKYDYYRFINDDYGPNNTGGIDDTWQTDQSLAIYCQGIIDELMPKIKAAEATKK